MVPPPTSHTGPTRNPTLSGTPSGRPSLSSSSTSRPARNTTPSISGSHVQPSRSSTPRIPAAIASTSRLPAFSPPITSTSHLPAFSRPTLASSKLQLPTASASKAFLSTPSPGTTTDAKPAQTVKGDPSIVNQQATTPQSTAHRPSVKMRTFLDVSSEVQAVLFRRYRGPSGMFCSLCSSQEQPQTIYRCKECWKGQLYCRGCMVASHRINPLHIVEEWTMSQKIWVRKTLGELDMVIRVGGHEGGPCPSRVSFSRKVCVVTMQGVQEAQFEFCECRTGGENPTADYVQLLETGLWPGTWAMPRTVFSLDVLDTFKRFSTQGNITAQDFLATLVRQTDGVTPSSVKDRYREFLIATREYQFVKWCMRKSVKPSADLEARSLCTLCPACPHIDINIDPGWTTRPEQQQYLDALFHAVDGNFTQNMKDKGSDQEDLPLTLGAAYFAHELDAKKYFSAAHPPKNQTSSCNKFGAMGYYGHWGAVSGIIGLSCARHMFVLPGGAVDLKLGETWAAVDFLMLSGLQPWMDLKLHYSAYDINCQYRIKFWERVKKIAQQFCINDSSTLESINQFEFPPTRAAVGKFHEPAHKLACRLLNSFHYLPGAGQTDGEALERLWAAAIFLGLRTREMTPGNRHDTTNYFNDDMNWRRTCNMATSLVKKYADAVKYAAESGDYLNGLVDEINALNLPDNIVDQWNAGIQKWEGELIDASRPPSGTQPHPSSRSVLDCPYEPVEMQAASKQQQVELLQKRANNASFEGVDLADVIREGIELQELRANLTSRLSRSSSGLTDEKITQIQEDFSSRMTSWDQAAQAHFGSALATSLASLPPNLKLLVLKNIQTREDTVTGDLFAELYEDEDDDEDEQEAGPSTRKRKRPTKETAEQSKQEKSKETGTKLSRKFLGDLRTFEIHLPSSYPPEVRACPGLRDAVQLEMSMRQVHAKEALDQVRIHLAATYGLRRHQAKSTTQQQKLRNRGPSQRVRSALYSAANTYERARNAMVALGMKVDDPTYRPIKKSDLKVFILREADRKWGDSRSTKESWIMGSLSFVDGELTEDVRNTVIENLRVHWCRSKAKADRWAEEKELVVEEMKRTLRFFDYQQHLWQNRARAVEDEFAGPAVYARKQAFTYQRLLDHSRNTFGACIPSLTSTQCPYLDKAQNVD